jgi:hypothetical protein
MHAALSASMFSRVFDSLPLVAGLLEISPTRGLSSASLSHMLASTRAKLFARAVV